MPQTAIHLRREELVDLAIDGYFGSVARRDTGRLATLIAPGCVMRVASAGIAYEGQQAILDHFEDFLGTYGRIEFADFDATADEAAQKVAVRFTITLFGEDDPIVMTNCNFFSIDEEGRIGNVAIYMSDLPDKGF